MSTESRIAIRDSLRQSRRDMDRGEQEAAAKDLFNLVGHEDFYRVANKIAFYLSVDGEINPKPLLDLALSEGKSCYLPVVTEDNPEFIAFAPYLAGTALEPNKWGIPEPPSNKIMSPTEFDVVFVPLVGFSQQCFRLGMGKGFYDRTFSFKIFNRRSRPLLVGLAHECQLGDDFPVESWDVRLDAVATEKKIYRPETA